MASSEALALQLARKIFLHGVEAVVPSHLVRDHVKLNKSILKIQNLSVDLTQFKNSYVVGFGKAVLPMAEELLSLLGGCKINRCVLSVPEGTRLPTNPQIEMYQGAKNNTPDLTAFEAASHIVNLAKSCSPDDLLIVLISGGGSALLPVPKPPVTLEEKKLLFQQLSSAGATINELNSVRKRISLVKGGGLARLCNAKQIVSLILSDVLEDKLDVIASGPTVGNTDDNAFALKIISKYVPYGQLNPNISKALSEPLNTSVLSNVSNLILGNNLIALQACASKARMENLIPVILTHRLSGEARNVGTNIATVAYLISLLLNYTDSNDATRKLENALNSLQISSESVENVYKTLDTAKQTKHSICLLLGGETTVNVNGSGVGGRNQELALAAAIRLHCLKPPGKITVMSAGTDGIDGPCAAAGAVVNPEVCSKAILEQLDPEKHLETNDSFNFFSKLSSGMFHIITGHTGTNVMDIVIVIVEHSNVASL